MKKILSTIYVSQLSGDDSLSGGAPRRDAEGNGPFRTLEHALRTVALLRQEGFEHPLTVSLVDDYFTSAPIEIKDADGVTLESFGTRKRIVGGVRIEGWHKGEWNGKDCLCASLPDRIPENFTDFYVNGERAAVTRFPKEGKLRIADADGALTGEHVHSEHMLRSAKWIRAYPDDLAGLQNVADAMIHYSHFWIDEHSPLDAYDPKSGRMDMTYASRFSVSTNYEQDAVAAPLYYLTNIPNCFEEPGHWYVDRRARMIYYIPKNEQITPDTIEAFAPVSGRLITVTGKHVYLSNLELTCSCGDYASTLRYSSTRPDADRFASDIQSFCGAPGAIRFQKAESCGMNRCSLHGVGVYGIEILENCHNLRIENNHIYDICAGGIRIAGGTVTDDPSLATSDCIIRGNHIHACGRRYLAGCGILLINAHRCELSENEIHDMEYSGISAGWVWGYADSATYGTVISKNHIYDIGKGNLSDLGGIYLLGKQKGTVVSQNRIHDIRCAIYGAWGIYLDEGSSFVTVEENLVYRTGKESFHLHYGSHNTLRRNLFIGENSCIRITKKEEHRQVAIEENLFVTIDSPVYGFLREPPLSLTSNRNRLWEAKKNAPLLWRSESGQAYGLAAWQEELRHDTESTVETTPDCLDRWAAHCLADRSLDLRELLEEILRSEHS